MLLMLARACKVCLCVCVRVSGMDLSKQMCHITGRSNVESGVTNIRAYTLAPGAEQHIRRKSSRACQNNIGTTRGCLFMWEGL